MTMQRDPKKSRMRPQGPAGRGCSVSPRAGSRLGRWDGRDINQLGNGPLRGHHSCRRDAGLEGRESTVVTGALVSGRDPEEEADGGHRRRRVRSAAAAPEPRAAHQGGQRLGGGVNGDPRMGGRGRRPEHPFLSVLKQNCLPSRTVWTSSLESSRLQLTHCSGCSFPFPRGDGLEGAHNPSQDVLLPFRSHCCSRTPARQCCTSK